MNMPTQLDHAKAALAELREELKDQPELLACYEPSAILLVTMLGGTDDSEAFIKDGADRKNLRFQDINWSNVNAMIGNKMAKAFEEESPYAKYFY